MLSQRKGPQKKQSINHPNQRVRQQRAKSKKSGLTFAVFLFIITIICILSINLFSVRSPTGTPAPPSPPHDDDHHRSGGIENKEEHVGNIDISKSIKQSNSNKKGEEEELHYGWQPKIQTDCSSYRDCFKSDHQCPKTCRDDSRDVGTPPVVENWIPDVTLLRRMAQHGVDANGIPWPPKLSDELCEKMNVQGGKNNDINKEALDAIPVRIVEKDTTTTTTTTTKVLCMVYTMKDAHATKIRAIRETWASRCDGFLAFTTESDPRIPAISIPHDGAESYGNMWQKVRSIWKFVHKHYVNDFDFFYLGGDDLFVIPENLRAYLSTLPPNEKHFVGRRFKGYGRDNYFNSGGAGYALSKQTLLEFRSVMDDSTACSAGRETAMEDVMIAKCLRVKLNIPLTDTRDSQQRERFHPFAPASHYTWTHHSDWYEDYNKEWGIKLGKDCCAPDSVSFHYIKKPAMVRHLFALLYQCK